MILKQLLASVPVASSHGSLQTEVTGIQYDSRRVTPGQVFVALRGERTDGHQFVEQAIHQGAAAVVVEKQGFTSSRVTSVQVTDTVEALAKLSAAFYEHPTQALKMIGVTGTNGKTTTTFMIKSLLENHDLPSGLIGTIRYELGERQIPADRTTPQSSDLQQMFAQMRRCGCKAAVMEVSSHSLSQKRVAGIDFDVAVFTNLTQDHLDYHKTMDAYFEAKAILFAGLGQGRKTEASAVINADDSYAARFKKSVPAGIRTLTYGIESDADFKASDLKLTLSGADFALEAEGAKWPVHLPLCGRYNVSNALAAIAAARALGLPLKSLATCLKDVPQVPGRMEAVRAGQPFHVFVDYAHTDDALRNVASTLKEIGEGRLLLVFGCGGNRDEGKRPKMGRVASELADYSIITSDNPRREDPAAIARAIEQGFAESSKREVILDRQKAIARALELARPGDCVLIAGKGHETYQEFEDTRVPFDDRDCAAAILKRQTWKS
ncbi:MAG: UDP-N-acetylmuramoyl-L-alanyl-D-glutamate--2,6-diaminopimelate ligase [Verrucomicrobiae bacterium]|nr:UDP-N-acetylmuramoyl-L-alanyl-D-glutamate--2,6-diaminopimelate ligase [Verrucomicrobiae bacterium]